MIGSWICSTIWNLESFVQTIDDDHNLWYDLHRLVLRKLSKPWVVFCQRKWVMKEYNNLEIIKCELFHDRFIIIDNKILYHSGASFKDLGKKCFALTKIEDEEILKGLLKYMKEKTNKTIADDKWYDIWNNRKKVMIDNEISTNNWNILKIIN